MEILQKTPTLLTLRRRPVRLWIVATILMVVVPFLLLVTGFNNAWLFYIWWYTLLPIFLFILGLLLLNASIVVTCTFDKTLGKVTLKQKSLLKTKLVERSLRDILDVQIETTSWNRDSQATYEIVLFLRGGHTLCLNLAHTIGQRHKPQAVDVIREFLGLPPKQF